MSSQTGKHTLPLLHELPSGRNAIGVQLSIWNERKKHVIATLLNANDLCDISTPFFIFVQKTILLISV